MRYRFTIKVPYIFFVKALLLFSIVFLANSVYGQHHYFRQYSLDEGLPQSEVSSIAEDQFGYLWMGTNGGGLCRFNGLGFDTYTQKDGLPSNIITGLHSDCNYNLWVGTPNGISKYDGTTFQSVIQSDTAIFQDDMVFQESIDGYLWALTYGVNGIRELLQIENDSVKNISQLRSDIFDKNPIIQVCKYNNRDLLIATTKGLFQMSDNHLEKSTLFATYTSSSYWIPLFQDKSKSLWVIHVTRDKRALYKVDVQGKKQEVATPFMDNNAWISNIYQSRSGDIWMAVPNKGVYKYSRDSWQSYTTKNGLPSNIINSFIEDREGNIWIGTSGSGILKYTNDMFITFNKQSGIGGNVVRTIFEDTHQKIYFTDDNNQISVYDGEHIQILPQNVKMGQCRKILQLPNQQLLFACLKGLFKYNGKTFENVNAKYHINSQNTVTDILFNKDTLCIALYGQGLMMYYPNGKHRLYTTSNSALNSSFITSMHLDSSKKLWICSNHGICSYQNGSVTNYTNPDISKAAMILQAAEDAFGNIWFATFSSGLCKYDGTSFEFYNTQNGIKSDNIYSVISDSNGNIWAGTQNGIDKITFDANGEIASIKNYNKADGFVGIENNSACNLLDSKGRLWFGTINGAIMYNPEKENVNLTEPPVYITEVQVDYKNAISIDNPKVLRYDSIVPWFKLPSNLHISNKQNHITFKFNALNYSVPEKVKFRWRLTPLETDWLPSNSLQQASYTSLPPGKYTFEVIAANNDNIWNTEGSKYSFVVYPEWYQQTWIKVLAILLIASVITWISRWRFNQIKNHKRDLEIQLNAQKKEIDRQHSAIKEQNRELTEHKNKLEEQSVFLQSANRNLQRLTQIGQLITANLSVDKIAESVFQSVRKVMRTDLFAIALFNESEQALDFTYSYHSNERQPFVRYFIEDKERLAIYSFTHDTEIFINDFYQEYNKYINEIRPVPSGAETESIIYIPLKTQKDILGIITVQSIKKNAYSDYDYHFIQNIANYTSIAIENALTYEKLMSEQNLLINKHEDILLEKDDLNKEKEHLHDIIDSKNQLLDWYLSNTQSLFESIADEFDQTISLDDKCSALVNNIWLREKKTFQHLTEMIGIQQGEIEPTYEEFEILKCIQECMDNLAEKSDAKSISVNLIGKATSVVLDKRFTTTIVEYLLENAILSTPEYQSVDIIVSTLNSDVRIEIKDHGAGLTPEEQKELFSEERIMSSTNFATKHLLYIAYRYTKVMNGSMNCISEKGFGTSFILNFGRPM